MKYDVTITRTGGIVVEAESAEEAVAKMLDMSVYEIEEKAQITGWEPSDAQCLEAGE